MHVVANPNSLSVPVDSFPKSLEKARSVASREMSATDVSEVSFSLYDELDDEGLVENILLLRWSFKRFGAAVALVELADLLEHVSLEPDVVLAAIDTALRENSRLGYGRLCLQNAGYTLAIVYRLQQPASVREPLEVWAPLSLHNTIASKARELGYVLA